MLISQSGHAGEKDLTTERVCFSLIPIRLQITSTENTVAMFYLRHPWPNIPMHVLAVP